MALSSAPASVPDRVSATTAVDAGTPRTAYAVLAAISFSHLLNDTLQSLLPAIYPVLKSTFHLNFAQVGMMTLERERQPQFIQIQPSQEKGDYSEATAREIDSEVRRIIDEQYERVKRLLGEKRRALQEGAKMLLEREVIGGAELKAIMDRA